VVDPLASRSVNVQGATTATLALLASAGIEVKPARIIDLTVAGARYDTMKSALDIILAAPEFDLVLAVIGSSARHYPQETVRPLIEAAAATGKPLAAFLVPDAPDALAALSRAGLPNFRTPEACADAVAAALARRAPLPAPAQSFAEASASGPVLDEVASGALIERLGIARAPGLVVESDIAQAPPLPFHYPVAVKVLSADIAHKSDIGGVVLGVSDGASLVRAIQSIRGALTKRMPALSADRMLVQPMIAGIGEVLVGYRVDRDVEPLIMLAAGGVFTEVARDRALRLAPVDLAGAHEMITQLRSLVTLSGYRSKPKGDLDALARAIVALSQLADDPSVLEAEINPLMVLPQGQGVMAVDALVKLARKA
jgi:acyl-CoA synthetase (NDP forming)